MSNKKIMLIPDVHGRTFWKEAINIVDNDEYEKIVFMGDYLDPYPHEGITQEESIVNFEDILDFKKKHMDKVVLLLGNHDCGYIWESVCSSRRMKRFYSDISNMFRSNIDLFDIAYSTKTDNQKYLITHAGVHKAWLDRFIDYIGAKATYDDIDIFLNNVLHSKAYDDALEIFLGIYSYFRGWLGDNYGSCIWADVREWSEELPNAELNKELGYFQIFGHTQLESNPIVQDQFACLDCRRYFILDGDKLKDKLQLSHELEHPVPDLSEFEYVLYEEQ